MGAVEDYLKMEANFLKKSHRPPGFIYTPISEFVLKNGKFMGSRSIASNQCPKGEAKQCFYNAYHLASMFDFIYCEGYAAGIIPVHHAWCIDEDGNILDNTWDTGEEYFGVPFDLKYVNKTILKRKKYGVIDNWEMKWPLLRGEHF
jgi:hypothetical protein